ncbi:hypothetical protein EON63_10310 [archaeon]|nr:MAG: hypothetical protein EON63_10310 [archaeon]
MTVHTYTHSSSYTRIRKKHLHHLLEQLADLVEPILQHWVVIDSEQDVPHTDRAFEVRHPTWDLGGYGWIKCW